MTKEFTIRTYTKKELALMYFPDAAPRTAVNHLTAWLRKCTPLWDELLNNGYRPKQKTLTPRQVKTITEYLGDP
jgi:hypothetical protein